MVDDDDAVGQRVGLLEILRREQHGDAVGQQLPDGLPHTLPARRIQPRRRLVQEEHRRTRHQRCRQVEAPAHAARIPLEHAVRGVTELELGQELGRPVSRRDAAHVGQLTDQHEVLASGQQRVESGVLGGDADVAPHLAGLLHHVEARDRPPPGIGEGERRQDAHGGRLAGSVRPEQAQDGAGRDAEIHAGQGLGGAVALLEPLGLDHEVVSHGHSLPVVR
jgi:hypothetical protein